MRYLYLKDFWDTKSKRDLTKAYLKKRILKVGLIPSKVSNLYKYKFNSKWVFITSKALLHIYDRRKAFLCEILIPNIENILKIPDDIFINSKKERGLIFVKQIGMQKVLLVLNYANNLKPRGYYVVTAFVGRERYLQKLKCL